MKSLIFPFLSFCKADFCSLKSNDKILKTNLTENGVCDFEKREIEFFTDLQIPPFLRLLNFRNNKLTSLNETIDFSAAEIVDFSFNNLSCIPDLQKSAQLILLHGNPINCEIENFEPFFGFKPIRVNSKNLEFVCQTPNSLAGRSISSLTLKEIENARNLEEEINEEFCSHVGVIFASISITLFIMISIFAIVTYRNRNSPFWSLLQSSDKNGTFDMNFDGDRDSLAF
ncbi:unnamed protein product [Oikopleura dioica]|uniref:LRRCT domain-containing protein n=1 Tax=Oikopleura dioica TaxID=34765 RepID=E4XTN8_OIKDI|nr:unnamed protein product [Oikopleura dioica]